jgi:polysaccharide pyruvyl transferase WcaK-like protein
VCGDTPECLAGPSNSTHRQVTGRNHAQVLGAKLATKFIYLIYQGKWLEHFERIAPLRTFTVAGIPF